MSDQDAVRPLAVVRAPVRTWARRLAWSLGVVLVGSAAVLAEWVSGILAVTAQIAVALAFLLMTASLAVVTVRLRTSLRSDGRSLAVRWPFGVSVLPLHDGLAFGRWLDEARRRPVIWVTDHGAPVVIVPHRLDPVRVELFASRVGLEVADREGAPPEPPAS